MIVEGLKLTVLGMAVVYLFLALLIAVINLSARLLRPWTEREALAAASAAARGRGASAQEKNRKVMAVIGAAVAAHRGRGRRG
ncbi:MAG: OadG family protein [Deferrisomatales bacterium]